MIGTTRSVRVFAYGAAADMRKGFNGLYGLITDELGRDPLSGDCFLFVSKRRTRAKVMLWDGTGLCIFSKRLERGRFASLWTSTSSDALELTMSELSLFLEGCELVGKRPLSPAQYRARGIEQRPSA